MPNRKNILEKGAFLQLLLAVLLVLVTALLSYANWRAFIRSTEQLAITRDITQATATLLSTLKDAETGQRGYLLLGRDSYLEPYRQAISQMPSILSKLTGSSTSRPDQAQRIEALRPLVQKKVAELQETIDLRRSKGLDAAAAV